MQRLAGSVNPYSRHFLVKTPNVVNWPSKIAFANPFVNTLLVATTKLKRKELGPAKVTCSDFNTVPPGPHASKDDVITNQTQADVVVFPESVMFKDVNAKDLNMLIDWINECDALKIPLYNFTNRDQANLAPIPVARWGKSTYLVCTHQEMDCRCGEGGTQVYNHLHSLNLNDTVLRTSHIGGHEFAANVIVHPPSPKGQPSIADWYGGLNVDNIGGWLETLKSKRMPWQNWRGRFGLTKEQQLAAFEKQ